MTIGRFTNPADKLAQVAASPATCLKKDITTIDLANQCKLQLKEYIELDTDFIDSEIVFNDAFTEIAATRKVGFCRQFSLLFGR